MTRSSRRPLRGAILPLWALIVLALTAPSVPAHPLAPPANDDLADAMPIASLPFTDRQVLDEAGDEAGEVMASCAFADAEMGVWYRYVAPSSGASALVLDTAGSTREADEMLDTVLSVWTGGPGHPLQELVCNDDVESVDFTSRVVLRTDPGATYYIKVGTNEIGGRAVLNARATVEVPRNDDLADATAVTRVPFSDRQDLRFATMERGEAVSACQFAWPEENGVWYALGADTAASMIVDTQGSTDGRGGEFDTVLSAWTGQSGHPLDELVCNDDAGSEAVWSRMVLDLVPGETVYVKVSGVAGTRGVVALNVQPLPSAPAHDALADALHVQDLPFLHAVDTSGATMEPDEVPASCAPGGASERGVWYRFAPAQDGRTVLAVTDYQFSPVVSVWVGDDHPLQEVACSADRVGAQPVGLILDGEAGRTYFVKVAGLEGQGGQLTFVASSAPPEAANDDLADALRIGALPFSDRRATSDATDEPGEVRPSCGRTFGTERAVWYAYEAGGAARLRIEGTAGDGLLDVPATVSVWSAGSGHPLTELACATAPRSAVVDVVAGQAVFIKIGPALDQKGTVFLRVDEAPSRPSNDDLSDALEIAPLPFSHTADTFSASDETMEVKSGCNFDPTSPEAGVWYRYRNGAGARIVLDTAGSDVGAAILSVWRGGPGHPLVEVTCSSRIVEGGVPRVTLEAEPEETYYVKTSGDVGLRGRIALNVDLAPSGPANDDLRNAMVIDSVPFVAEVDTRAAGDEPGENRAGCALGAGPERGVWFVLERPEGAAELSVTVRTEGSDFDTVLSAWTGGAGHPLTQVACNDDAAGAPWSELGLRLEPGSRTYVKAGGTGATSGILVLAVRADVEAVYLPFLER